MPYSPTAWVDGTTPPINAANLNNIEQGIVAAVLKAGDTMTGVLTMTDGSQVRNGSGPGTLAVDGTTYSGTYYKVNGNVRYFMGADNTTWKLSPFTDAGSEDSGKAVTFARATGDIAIGGKLTLGVTPVSAMEAATKAYTDTKWTMWSGTQAAYDAIGTKDPNTLYVII